MYFTKKKKKKKKKKSGTLYYWTIEFELCSVRPATIK